MSNNHTRRTITLECIEGRGGPAVYASPVYALKSLGSWMGSKSHGAVSEIYSLWEHFVDTSGAKFEYSPLFHKMHNTDMATIAVEGADDDEYFAISAAVMTCEIAMRVSSAVHNKQLHKTVIVVPNGLADNTASELRKTFPSLIFCPYSKSNQTHLFYTGNGTFEAVAPGAHGVIVDVETALWIVEEGWCGSVIVYARRGEMDEPAYQELHQAVIREMKKLYEDGKEYGATQRRVGRAVYIIPTTERARIEWEDQMNQ